MNLSNWNEIYNFNFPNGQRGSWKIWNKFTRKIKNEIENFGKFSRGDKYQKVEKRKRFVSIAISRLASDFSRRQKTREIKITLILRRNEKTYRWNSILKNTAVK